MKCSEEIRFVFTLVLLKHVVFFFVSVTFVDIGT